jgi:glucokinase
MGSKTPSHTIGIDIGGTKILAVALDPRFHVLAQTKLKTKPERGADYFLDSITEAVDQTLQEAHVRPSQVLAVGAGCPGFINSNTGVVANSANLPFLQNYPLAKKLSKRLKRPVTIGNDVQTGLYGEHQFGAARGLKNVVGIFMGTGIGGSIIIDGKTYSGTSGSAGEVGHVLFDANGPFCGCGRRGCYEAYAGRLAIASECAAAAARQRAPTLYTLAGTDLRAIKSGVLARAASKDRAVTEILRSKAQIVGTLMTQLVNILNPEMIVLGGGVVQAMPRLIVGEAERTMRALAIPNSARRVRVTAAKLGDYSVAMGAAKRAWDRFGGDKS